MTKWVARLKCGHVAGGEHAEVPAVGTYLWCNEHNDIYAVAEVITNEPERLP